jgi:hypothetical protein
MRRVMTIFATALLASSLLTVAAEARATGSAGHVGGFAGAHLGGISGFDRIEGLGRVHVEDMADGDHGPGFAHHAMHRGFRAEHGIDDSSNCYYPDELPKYPPWPPYCS